MRVGRIKENYKPRDEYYTPAWVFESLGLRFDLDPAHPNHPTNVPVLTYYTQQQDGLQMQWFGRVWMNPPFSQSTVWVHKFMMHKNGIALLPIAKSRWFNEIWDDCDGVIPLTYKTKFTFEGSEKGSIFLPVALFGYGEENIQAMRKLGRVR